MAKFIPKKNKYILSGKNGKIALQLLNDVTDVLDKYDVKYWLDFGTLLGVVREDRILPWDDDIDLSIFESDIEVMKTKVMPEIKKLRYRGYIRYFTDNVQPLKNNDLRSFKIRNNRFFFLRGYVKLDIFVLYNIDKKLYWVEHSEPHSLPEDLLTEFDMIKFNGKDYRIPKDYDKYLTYHYGDWRTPNEDYNSSIDNVRTLDK
jgi:phosphorylcholine metabolism protein LicD